MMFIPSSLSEPSHFSQTSHFYKMIFPCPPITIFVIKIHCVKSVQIRSYFWSVFSCIRTEYGDLLVNLHIESEYRKIRTRNNSAFGHFSISDSPAPFITLLDKDNYILFGFIRSSFYLYNETPIC